MLAQALLLGVIVLRETITLGTEHSVTARRSSTGNYDDPLKVPQRRTFGKPKGGTGKPHKLETQILVGALGQLEMVDRGRKTDK